MNKEQKFGIRCLLDSKYCIISIEKNKGLKSLFKYPHCGWFFRTIWKNLYLNL